METDTVAVSKTIYCRHSKAKKTKQLALSLHKKRNEFYYLVFTIVFTAN